MLDKRSRKQRNNTKQKHKLVKATKKQLLTETIETKEMNLSDFVTFPPAFACYVLMQVENKGTEQSNAT